MDFISLFAAVYSYADFLVDTSQIKYVKLVLALYVTPNALISIYMILRMRPLYSICYFLNNSFNNFLFGVIGKYNEYLISYKKNIIEELIDNDPDFILDENFEKNHLINFELNIKRIFIQILNVVSFGDNGLINLKPPSTIKCFINNYEISKYIKKSKYIKSESDKYNNEHGNELLNLYDDYMIPNLIKLGWEDVYLNVDYVICKDFCFGYEKTKNGDTIICIKNGRRKNIFERIITLKEFPNNFFMPILHKSYYTPFKYFYDKSWFLVTNQTNCHLHVDNNNKIIDIIEFCDCQNKKLNFNINEDGYSYTELSVSGESIKDYSNCSVYYLALECFYDTVTINEHFLLV